MSSPGASGRKMLPGQAPPHKRARIQASRGEVEPQCRGEDDYMRGNIVRIELHNFMTYGHIEARPGPRLNLVIGPNGTGKSSLVCAIALGLGGDPQILGRSQQVGDFVKRGEESGWTRITLRGTSSGETIVIRRNIDKQNKSDWLLDEKPVSKKHIQETVRQFNIQVNNLTQFLPQDRVCDFAKMSPIELLKETEKAVGDPELYDQHTRLVNRNQEVKQRQVTVRSLETTLAQHKANNAELEKDVERVQERNALYTRAEAMKKKLPWLKYDREKSAYEHLKKHRKDAAKKLQDITQHLANLRAPISQQKRKRDVVESKCKELRDEKLGSERRRKNFSSREAELRGSVQAKMSGIEEHRRAEAQRQQKIENAKKALADSEEELAGLPLVETPREEMERLGAQIQELELAAQERRNSIIELRNSDQMRKNQINAYQRRISDIQNVTNQRLELLRRSGASRIFDAHKWVSEHRQDFKKHVYGPVLLEVGIPNRDVAAFVEGQVAMYIWKAFITQDPEDRDLLFRNLKPFDVPVINFRGGPQEAAGRMTQELAALGVQGTLDELVTAPQTVKDVLIGQFSLNHSYYGTALANQNADQVCTLGVRDLWTPENHFRWQESRYGGPMSASVLSVRPARLFSPSVDRTELDDLERKIAEAEEIVARQKEGLHVLTTELRDCEERGAVLQRQREELLNATRLDRRRRTELKNRIEQRKRKVESLESEEDLEAVLSRLQADIVKLNLQRYENAFKTKKCVLESVAHQIRLDVQLLASAEEDGRLKSMERQFKGQEYVGIQAQQEYDALEESFNTSLKRLKDAKAEAESVVCLSPETQASFAGMPDTVEDLEDSIEECISQARAVICPNPNVLQEYEERCRQIDQVSTKLEVESAALNRFEEEIENIKASWLNSLRAMVGKINTTFSRNFQEMAVAGEVSLDEQGTDFDKYGIHIKVKFREAGLLQVLSAHHQSGGERSVSTILYLVSLQDLTHCPFRVVDEINQGMDPINERKMFQQLVRAASQPNTSQCFLLTPKLLPDLEYSEACSILNIMNGPWIENTAEIWKSGSSYSELCTRAPPAVS